ncbi:hypothetical protein H9185_001154 [Listeria monocytogenes]|nr:hypothetical protein [Listeria monocytogenes]
MYIVKIYNNGVPLEIQNEERKLKSGNVVKGINAIDSCTFTILPNNPGFNRIRDKKTLVTVYNTNKNRFEFHGRALYSAPAMDSSGLITKAVTCESFFGFLCDSEQIYVEEKNWTVEGLLEHIINTHNSQVEDYKHFAIGEVTVTDPNNNLYVGIQRKKTWETIKEKLLDKLGGEIRFRVVDDVIYIDYLTKIGVTRTTEIALSRNMKSITQENDPTAYVTRFKPLGCKLTREEISTDENGNETVEIVETEERLDISSVNNGLDYIVDESAEAAYGINVHSETFDDITEPSNLFTRGTQWLAENNRVKVKYSISALDLSLLGLDIDDFDVHNYHPIKNALLGIDDTARIIKKTIDICNETSSTIEVGDNFKTLSDIQLDQAGKIDGIVNTVGKIESDYVTNDRLISESLALSTLIQQTVESILLTVSETYQSTSESEEFKETVESQLQLLADQMNLRFTETIQQIENVNGDLQTKFNEITKYFTFDINGLTIGQVDNPNRVVIDNDEISILVNGAVVQKFDSEGKALIPELNVTRSLNLFGYLIDQDANGNVNCEYVGG